uniref:Putative ubiquitin-specific protease n=1 Tax=Ornithodoros turicata TaxID=34597 RepID=A0A2R5L974_9ACAR
MSITRTKGLLNMPGQNNCFLNSAVQVLWHLDIFRRSFRDLSGHVCMAESCIFCALKELFAQFQYSKESALPPDALRRALAETFFDQRRFQLGFMDDAAECFENILLRIHFHIASQEAEDMCSVGHCIPHQKFAMTLVEQTVCHVCGASSEPLPFTQMVHYVSASALCSQASLIQSKEQSMVSFGELLWRAGGMGDIRDCPSSCGAKIQICRTLMNRPDIVSLGLVWDSERPTVDHITDVLDTIGTSINMQEMFHSVVDSRWAASVTHHLVGIVTYYGKHYSTFFFHTKLGVWIYFDDATVREIGPHWQQVVDKCRRGHFQPLLLLYANPSGTPVQTANAPSTVINCMSDYKRKQIELQEMMSERHKYSQQHPACSPSDFSAQHSHANGTRDRPQWSHTNWTQSSGPTYNTSNGSTRKNIAPHSHVPSNNHLKHRLRTYSDTSIMSESPSDCINKRDDSTADSELDSTYISRQAVESILNMQRLQRQRTLNGGTGGVVVPGSRNSSSSLESFENSLHMREKALEGGEGALRRRDSGNWSGDRNSASSSSSTSLDGSYYYTAGNKRLLGGTARVVNNFSKHEYMNVGVLADQGYDSYSLSSTDSYPSVGLPGSPGKLDTRLKQIPEAPVGQAKTGHPDLDSLQDEVFASTASRGHFEDCDKLCMQVDILLKKSCEKEQAGDLNMAVFFCDAAAVKARAAMDAPYSNAQALNAAKMKHSLCVMRSNKLSRSLKEVETEDRRWHKEASHEVHHSRQGSRDSTHSQHSHSRQGSRDGSQVLGDAPSDKPVNNIEIYATLPKKGSKKKANVLESQSLRIKEDTEIYKYFLTKQRQNNKKDADSSTTTRCKPKENWSHNKNLNSMFTKEPELSDYCSEWEQTKKPPLHRTLSNPAGMKNHDSDGNNAATSAATKKQHKIRRKLMGGFMRRKNRSLPDLRENQDALQAGSRSFDDTAIFKSGKDTKTSLERKARNESGDEGKEEQSATIKCRGFHQPHRAFVARGLCHRPLLTKVDPPHVEVARSPSPVKTHAARSCSPVKRNDGATYSHYTNASYRANSYYPANDSDTNCSDLENYEVPSSENLPPPASPLLAPTPDISSDVEQTVAEESCLLKEIQAKRKQIMNARSGEASSNATASHSDTQRNGELSRTEFAPNSLERNWLQELQSKQISMLTKAGEKLYSGHQLQRGEQPEQVLPNGNKPGVPLQSTSQQRQHENVSQHEKTSPYKQKDVLNDPTSKPCESKGDSDQDDAVKPRSVRDLASRFEKILKPPTVEPSEDAGFKTGRAPITAHQPLGIPTQPCGAENKDIPPSTTVVTSLPYNVKCYTSSAYQAPVSPPQQTASAPSTNHLVRQQQASKSCPQTTTDTTMHMSPGTQYVQQASNIYPQPYANHAASQQQLNTIPSNHEQSPTQQYHSPPNSEHAQQSLTYTMPVQTSTSAPATPSVACTGGVYNARTGNRYPLPSQYGKAFQCVKTQDMPDARPFVAVRMPPQTAQPTMQGMPHFQHQQGGSDTSLRPVSPANSEPSKRPTRPPDYETALQRLEMMKVQQRTASPDCMQGKTGDTLCAQQGGSEQAKKRKPLSKKSVTFSDEVVLVACAEEEESVYIPNPLLERVYRQHAARKEPRDTVSQSEVSPLLRTAAGACDAVSQEEVSVEQDANSQVPCNLCHKKSVSPPTVYCSDCAFYMSRFQKRT